MPTGTTAPLPRILQHSFQAHKGPTHVVRYDVNGRYLVSGGADGRVRLWNASTGGGAVAANAKASAVATPVQTYEAHSYEVLALDVTPDNAFFASGGGDKVVVLWDVASGRALRRFGAHVGKVNAVRFGGAPGQGGAGRDTGASSVLAIAGFDSAVRFYDLRAQNEWRPIMELKEARDAITTMQLARDRVYTGSVDGVCRTYDLRAGQLRSDTVGEAIVSLSAPFEVDSTSVTSPDGALLVSTLDGTHRLLDTTDGTLLSTFSGQHTTGLRLRSCWAQAGAAVLAGGPHGEIQAWDVISGSMIPAGRPTPSSSDIKRKALLWVEASTAGREQSIVSGGADGLVEIWGNAPI